MARTVAVRWTLPLAVVLAACAGAESPDSTDAAGEPGARVADAGTQDIACQPTVSGEELTSRASPYDSVQVQIGGNTAQLCYSRPYMKGREIFGGLVPFGELWRTGANEPTIIHLPAAATIAGVAVEPGSYSIYTVPDRDQWQVIVNRSTSQWGHESRYTPEIEAQEVGRGTVSSQNMEQPVEQFTIRSTPEGDGANLVLEWETTRVVIPVRPG